MLPYLCTHHQSAGLAHALGSDLPHGAAVATLLYLQVTQPLFSSAHLMTRPNTPHAALHPISKGRTDHREIKESPCFAELLRRAVRSL
ncbi:hypothetical protein E2C01_009949 [Portunus trituberculatus]|uniref:Uncharacterized protein n=1 Tax=Portunus trituberculatus TaxID=210409 RepID=A0A5B7D729_PORTR|nr:hypothetical protein [Portunus trituberculatus]